MNPCWKIEATRPNRRGLSIGRLKQSEQAAEEVEQQDQDTNESRSSPRSRSRAASTSSSRFHVVDDALVENAFAAR